MRVRFTDDEFRGHYDTPTPINYESPIERCVTLPRLVIRENVCLGLSSLLNIWGHIATVPVCSSGTLTNVLPHRNAMPQTQDMTPHPVTVYRNGADLTLCYPLMWNVTLEYTATHFNVVNQTRPENPPPTFDTHTPANAQLYHAVMVVVSRNSVESTVPTGSWKTKEKWRTGGYLCLCLCVISAGGVDLSALLTALVMVGKSGITASFASVVLYSSEVFPTNIRLVVRSITSISKLSELSV